MRRKLGSFAAAIALVGGLLGVSTPPAHAHLNACGGAGAMQTGAPLYFVGFGPAVITSFAMVHPTAGVCLASPGSESFSGSIVGNCGLASGAGSTNQGHVFTFVMIGDQVIFTGQVEGYMDISMDPLVGENCMFGADVFLAAGTLYHDHI